MAFQPFTIGKYSFVDVLGKGGMGEVYRVQVNGPSGFQKEFAVKRITSTALTGADLVRMFEREAQITSILQHANIVQVYDFFRSKDSYMLVMEYVHGRNLSQVITKASAQAGGASEPGVPIELGVYVISEVCKGLDYAYRKADPATGGQLNIIHRDISPHNIMLSFEGAVKIVDFGIARVRDQQGQTEAGMLRGKIAYMAPEQAMALPVDHTCDIFSASLVLWELCTGKRAYPTGMSDLALLSRVQEGEIPKPSTLNPRVPSKLEQIIMKGLAKDPKDRYQSATQFQSELQEQLTTHWPHFAQKEVASIVSRLFADERAAARRGVLRSDAIPDFDPLSSGEQKGLLEGLTRLEVRRKRAEASAPAPAPRPPSPPPQPERGEQRSYVLPALMLAFLFVAAAAAYRHWELRNQAADGPIDPSPAPEVEAKRPTECVVTIGSSPPGARVTADKVDRGLTPAMLPAPCGQSINITLSLDGYKELSRIVTLNEPSSKLELGMTKAPPVEAPPADTPPAPREREPADVSESDLETWLAEVESSSQDKASLAKHLYDEGAISFKEGRYLDALTGFRKSRLLQPDFLPSWFYELRTLTSLHRDEEARKTARILARKRPDVKNLPALQQYLEPE